MDAIRISLKIEGRKQILKELEFDFSYSSEGDGLTFRAASVQERLIFEKYFFALIFAAINQERLLIKSDHYWRGYGIHKKCR